MGDIKKFFKKYFSSLHFFYSNIGNSMIFIAILSLSVSILDALGVSMFFPLLQFASGDNINPNSLGKFIYLIRWSSNVGLNFNIMTVLIIMILFFIFKGIASYFKEYYNVIIQHSFIRKLRVQLLDCLDDLRFQKFVETDSGLIQNTLTAEVDKLSLGFQAYFLAFQNGIMLLVYLGFAFFIDWKFALFVSFGGLLSNLFFRIIYTKTRVHSARLTEAGHRYQGEILQHILNFKYLKATGSTKTHSKRILVSILNIENFRKKLGFLSSLTIAIREPVMIIVVAIVIILQIKYFDGKMSAILVTLIFLYRALSFLMSMQSSWSIFLSVSGTLDSVENFKSYLENNREKNSDEKFGKLQCLLECKDLEFSFHKNKILENLNIQIFKNQTVALVGESGSGKTTLINILIGLLDAQKGEAIVDGKIFTEFNKITFQKRIGYIAQEPVIFNDSIYNNVSFWAEKNPENLEKFHRAVSLAALKNFIAELPEKEESILGLNGLNISGGQKQRISIARELYKDIDILIMDEATSSLDSETENSIQQSIENLKGYYTIIIIAHRLSTIKNVDKVFYMANGQIEAEGTFDELKKNFSKFNKMTQLQGI